MTEVPPTSSKRSWRPSTGVAVGLVGSLAITASVLGVSAFAAGAEDTDANAKETAVAVETATAASVATQVIRIDDIPGEAFHGRVVVAGPGGEFEDAGWEAFEACMDDAFGDLDHAQENVDFSALDGLFDGAEATCEAELPEELQADLAAWQPFDECMDTAIGDIDFESVTDDEIEAAFEAAEDQCEDKLPEGALLDFEAGEAFEACLAENGLVNHMELGSVVFVEDGDEFSAVEFGEAEGSVVISGTAGSLTVATDGGATVVDLEAKFEADEAAFEACEPELAEG
jgi:hypothetical protein